MNKRTAMPQSTEDKDNDLVLAFFNEPNEDIVENRSIRINIELRDSVYRTQKVL